MDNEVIKNMLTRRSVRSYQDKMVDDDSLDLVAKAGEYAASGMNRQPSTIVVVKDKQTRDLLSKMNAKIMGVNKDPYYGAPIIILVLADKNVHTYVEDATLVLANMMLAAHSLGLASCWIHREKEMFESNEGIELLKKWNLPLNLVGVGALAIGYAKGEIPAAHPRKDNYIVKI